jgi:[ribosomal protein S18]-alanine N-acetyltransferase
MYDLKVFDENNKPSKVEKKALVDFLFRHLDQFGDQEADIEKAIDYSVKNTESPGGFVIQSFHNDKTASVVVVNKTGMKGYIPENILVYIATHNELRGKGIGKNMMLKAIEIADGNIALHVEPDNPAKYLYEKIGFTNKYLEMRYIK